jgi:ABC-type Fe3+-siderophore transport system permease subunit
VGLKGLADWPKTFLRERAQGPLGCPGEFRAIVAWSGSPSSSPGPEWSWGGSFKMDQAEKEKIMTPVFMFTIIWTILKTIVLGIFTFFILQKYVSNIVNDLYNIKISTTILVVVVSLLFIYYFYKSVIYVKIIFNNRKNKCIDMRNPNISK